MKSTITPNALFAAVLLSLGCSSFAQAPAGVNPRPPQEADANKSGGPAADKAEMKKDAKKSANMSGGAATNSASMKSLDTNGDGMVSKAEWDAYHAGTWGKFKLKNGMATASDVEAMMKAGGGSGAAN